MHGDTAPWDRVGPRAADLDLFDKRTSPAETLFSKAVAANPSPIRFSLLCLSCRRMSIWVEASRQHQL